MRRGDAMRCTTRKRSFYSHCLQPCGALIIIILSALPILASTPILALTSDKLVLSDSVSRLHREELLRRLRAITGWTNLTFSQERTLQMNDTHTGGSQSARDLLSRAASGTRTIVFEDASSRKDVVFCRVILGKPDPDSSTARVVNVIQIDFTDFRHVTGDKEARAAFDVGWAVLHEIDHAVAGSRDPKEDDVAGDCEGHINKMRRELGLPIRNRYFYTLLPVKNDSNLISRFVRLSFEENGPAAKKRRYWLIWDAAIVGSS
jgi:hypothetical protein